MISVQQKRKATCLSAVAAVAIGSNQPNNDKNQSQKGPSRKRAKLATAVRSKLNQRQQLEQQQQHQKPIIGSYMPSGSPAATNAGCHQSQDESMWMFGLMNNIEQLLSTFNAINSSSHQLSNTKRASSSGSSTPSSLCSSFTSNSPPSSTSMSSAPSPSSTTPTYPNLTSSLSSQAVISSSLPPSSTATTLSPLTGSLLSNSNNTAQQSAALTTSPQQATGVVCQPLPRSPISRQIKFHEYKGPPSARRQQTSSAQANNNKHQQQQQTSTGTTSSSSKQPSQPQQKAPALSAPTSEQVVLVCAQQQVPAAGKSNNVPIEPISKAPAAAAHLDTHARLATAVNLVGYTQQQQQHELQSDTLRRHQVLNFRQELAAQAPQYHTTHILQQQVHSQGSSNCKTAGPNEMTSGHQPQQQTHCDVNSMQTIYINQQNTLEHSDSDGPTSVLLAPFVESNNKHNFRDHQQHKDQQEQQQRHRHEMIHHPDGSLMAQQYIQSQEQHYNQSRVQAQRLNVGPQASPQDSIGVDQRQQQQQQQERRPCNRLAANHVANSNQSSYLSSPPNQTNHITDCWPASYQQIDELEFNSNQVNLEQQQRQSSNLDFVGLTATFGPDSEETTDACEIEPSIDFSHGVDELLFSEFIDLQDVPMNVDESDWLKKFLPPCSMS